MNASLQATIKAAQQKNTENENIISKFHYAESSFKKEIVDLKKKQESLEREVAKKTEDFVNVKGELEQVTCANKETMRYQIRAEDAFRREEDLQEESKKQVESVKREGDSKNFELRRENASLKLEMHKRDEELADVQKNYSVLQEQYKEISGHYAKLHEEAKQMIYILERKEYDLNLFKSKTSAQAEGI
jgi:chromosome segregation ATPase